MTASIGDSKTYVISVPENDHAGGYSAEFVIIDEYALEHLAVRDIASYMSLIRHSPELWDAEWDWENPS